MAAAFAIAAIVDPESRERQRVMVPAEQDRLDQDARTRAADRRPRRESGECHGQRRAAPFSRQGAGAKLGRVTNVVTPIRPR